MSGKSKYKNMDSNSKRKKRITNWSMVEVAILLELWEERIPQLRGCKKNAHVYADIAVELAARGFVYSGSDVKIKVHNLTNKYRNEKKIVGVSGGSPSTWEHFEKINSFLGGFKSFNLEALVEESAEVVVNESDSSQSTPFSPMVEDSLGFDDSVCEPAKKKRITSYQQELLNKFENVEKNMDSQLVEINKVTEKLLEKQDELLAVEKERNVILKSFLEVFTQNINKQ